MVVVDDDTVLWLIHHFHPHPHLHPELYRRMDERNENPSPRPFRHHRSHPYVTVNVVVAVVAMQLLRPPLCY